VDGASQLNGPVVFSEAAGGEGLTDIAINGGLTRMRFFNADQSEVRASLFVDGEIALDDNKNNRAVFVSKNQGVGVGTRNLSSSAVTLAPTTVAGDATITGNANVTGNATFNNKVSVNGSLGVGYVQVESFFEAGEPYVCGLGNCRRFFASVDCPAGYWPVGGGISAIQPEGLISVNIISSNISAFDPQRWQCAYENAAGISDIGVCKAICLKIDGPDVAQ